MKDNVKKEKVCFQFACDKYPQCKRARGNCCAVDWDDYDDDMQVGKEECTEENGYPLFISKK